MEKLGENMMEIEKVYRVGKKEFRDEHEARKYLDEFGSKTYCAKCNAYVGLIGEDETLDQEVDWLKFKAEFRIDSYWDCDLEECENTYEIRPARDKYLCPECMNEFKNQLTEHKNLTEKLFDDFNLLKTKEGN